MPQENDAIWLIFTGYADADEGCGIKLAPRCRDGLKIKASTRCHAASRYHVEVLRCDFAALRQRRGQRARRDYALLRLMMSRRQRFFTVRDATDLAPTPSSAAPGAPPRMFQRDADEERSRRYFARRRRSATRSRLSSEAEGKYNSPMTSAWSALHSVQRYLALSYIH